jgi:hypothetical protein
MFAPADLTRFSIRAQRSLNRAGTTKLERHSSTNRQTNRQAVRAVGRSRGAVGGERRRSCLEKDTMGIAALCALQRSCARDGGREEKAVRDEHEPERSLDEERQRI